MPLIEPSLLAPTVNLLRPSATRKNGKRNNMHHFLRNLETLKIPKGDPFINATKEVEETQAKI